MPIRPENRALYPRNWPLLSRDAKERAGWRCVHDGCTARQYDYGYWIAKPEPRWVRIGGPCANYAIAKRRAAEEHFARFGDERGDYKILVIVLTTAHLNHDPRDCRPENLAPMCQRHHLAYDAELHRQTAYATRRRDRATGDLFEVAA
jgi:hypothetical protein